MNKQELIQAVATKVELTPKEVKVVLEAIVDTIVAQVVAGEKVDVTGLGRFDSAPTPEPDTNAGTEAPINGDHFEMDDVGIIKNPNGAKMYIQADPNTPSKRILGANTDWLITGRVVTPEGDLYYQVSTYEYVKASDMQVKSEVDESSKHRIIKANNPESFAVPLMAFKDDKPVRGNRGLSNNSFWAVDKTKVYDGHTYYRVSTNEWIIDTYATVTQ